MFDQESCDAILAEALYCAEELEDEVSMLMFDVPSAYRQTIMRECCDRIDQLIIVRPIDGPVEKEILKCFSSLCFLSGLYNDDYMFKRTLRYSSILRSILPIFKYAYQPKPFGRNREKVHGTEKWNESTSEVLTATQCDDDIGPL